MHWVNWLALIPLVSAACLQSNDVECGGGRICPGGTSCIELTNPAVSICASEEETKPCDNAPRYQQCSTSLIANGRCYDGFCAAVACGNGRVDKADPNNPEDKGEACDDGNQVSGDDCSADCLSTAQCGNAIIDVAKGEGCDDGNLVDNDGCDSKCQGERPGWTGVTEAEPYVGLRDPDPRYEGHRQDFAMAYDVAHDQTVMFGGRGVQGGRTVSGLDDTWIFDGRGWLQIKTDVQPIARYGHAMAYDAKRKRVVLFGGFSSGTSTALADTWEWDGVRWTAHDTAQGPAPRANHMMTYDGKRDVVVLYGGDHEQPDGTSFSNVNQYADTWLWDGTQWTLQVTATAPNCHQGFLATTNGRNSAGFGFDASRGVSVLWGGGCYQLTPAGGGGYYLYQYVADTTVWELDASGWTQRSPSGGPAASASARLAFSPLSRRMVVMTGNASEQWEWNGASWTAFAGPLPQHDFVAIVTDDERQRIVMHGGYSYYDEVDQTDYDVRYTHEWNGSSWQLVETKTPPALSLSTYDIRRGRAVAVDGAGKVYERFATAWTQVAGVLSAKPRAIAYDSARSKTVVYGVNAANSTIAETWTWDGASWSKVAGTQPPATENPAMAFDSKRGQVVFFGGCDPVGQTCSDATWLFDGTAWTNTTPAQRPSGRGQHVLAYDVLADKTVLFGGYTASFDTLQDTWSWDGTTWTQVSTAATPAGRTSAALVWQPKRERLALVGGWGTDGFGRTDTWEWIGTNWERVDAAPRIFGRGGAVVVPTHDGHALSVTGGYTRSPRQGQTLLIDGGWLSWAGNGLRDSCTDAVDFDGDSLAGCEDGDCAFTCTPLCPPTEAATCGAAAPRCGDASCATGTEDCRSCPVDCGTCTGSCSDSYCDPGETATSCPGDC